MAVVDRSRAAVRAFPASAAAFAVRTLSVALLAALAAGLVVLVRDSDGLLPAWSAIVFLAYGLLSLPAYRGLTAHLQRERARQAARDAGLVDAEALLELVSDLPSLGTLPRMARRLTTAVRDAFGAQTAALLVADPQSGRLQTLVSKPGEGEHTSELPVLLAKDDPALERLARQGRPMASTSLRGISHGVDRHLDSLEADLLVPLKHQAQLVGVLVLGPADGGVGYGDAQREVLGLVAHHIGTVVENARLFASATYESLTGLMRREAIVERLGEEVERADRYQRPLAVCMLDIDHFKRINDTYGHLAGDVVLRRVAAEVRSGLRTSDLAGRYGGEEFLIVLPETPHEQAAQAAENIRARVAALEIEIASGLTVGVQVSIGLASFGSIDTADREDWTEELIAAADRALYLAKESGRNRVEAGLVPRAVVAQLRREVRAGGRG